VVCKKELNNISKYLDKDIINDYRHLLDPKKYSDIEYPENWVEYKKGTKN